MSPVLVLGATMANPDDDLIRNHVAKYLGTPDVLELRHILECEPEISIMKVQLPHCNVLITHGMSNQPMTAPPEHQKYTYAELVLMLPKTWPLILPPLKDDDYWPIQWLLKLAYFPFEADTFIGGEYGVFSNGEPPEAFASNTSLSCFLAMSEKSDFGCLKHADGRHIYFYTLFPLYAEERDFELQHGARALLQRFQEFDISVVLDPQRQNVCVPR